MLSHRYRFHGHESLKFVFKKGKIVRGPHMTLRISKHPNRVHDRVAVVISKKISKQAVVRNRMRRRIFEIIRVHWLEIEAPYDVVFIVQNPGALNLDHESLKNEVLGLLKKGHMLHQV